jgi:hypothetical protein
MTLSGTMNARHVAACVSGWEHRDRRTGWLTPVVDHGFHRLGMMPARAPPSFSIATAAGDHVRSLHLGDVTH